MLRDFPQMHLLVGSTAHIYSRVMATTAPFSAPETVPGATKRPLAIARWLEAVAILVVLIVLVGGITRLTESGLSITHWSVVTGILPPLTEAAWIAEYELYQQTGEYKFESGPAGMDLDKFKFIYFWEWFHRILGRVIGLAFLLPMVWFWVRGMIPQGYKPRLLAMFALICGQGALGWYMVNSGVGTDLTDVSHFRLSAHLLTALFLLGGLVWTARDLRNIEAGPARLTGPSANWDVIFWGKNLADEDYLITGSRNRDANQFPHVVGPAYESWRTEAGLERTYGITLKYRFGGV